MDSNRKRPRLCGVPINKNRDTSLANLECESIFTTTDAIVGANVFLTLCDSDESQEYLAIDGNTLAHIKQEQQQRDHEDTQTLPLHSYRILNQMHLQQQQQHAVHQQPASPIADVSTLSVSTSSSPTAVLPATVQLPSGCEIYLVKEYVESANTQSSTIQLRRDVATTTMNCNEQLLTNTSTLVPTSTTATTTIKIEPGTHLATATNENGAVRIIHNNVNVPCMITPRVEAAAATAAATSSSTAATTGSVAVNLTSSVEDNADIKRSFILEAYKKRDDKRRATHNEVERRRRDKINSWIFKLKEMLPTDMPITTTTTTTNNNINNNHNNLIITSNGNCKTLTPTTTITNQLNIEQQRNALSHNINQTSRSPPSDSKSQILIKACEYIKAMQDEIKSLRECLSENEELRLRNERLQNELNVLRNVERINNNNNTNNNNNIISTINNNNNNNDNNFNVTLNTLSNNGLFIGSSRTSNNATTVATIVAGTTTKTTTGNTVNITTTPYTKRELIIRDYVD